MSAPGGPTDNSFNSEEMRDGGDDGASQESGAEGGMDPPQAGSKKGRGRKRKSEDGPRPSSSASEEDGAPARETRRSTRRSRVGSGSE